ncbi:unnamed protein product [Sphagnum tenellum]
MNDVQRERMQRNREIARHRLHSRMLQLDLGYEGSHKSLLESQAKLHRTISPSLETALEESRNIASQTVWDGFQNTSPPASSMDMTGIDRSDSSLRVSQQNTMKEISPLKKQAHIDHTQPTLLCYSGFVKSTQEFDYLVVIDFESTCDQPVNLQPTEIIEFPAVLVNLNMQKLEGSFRTYVRPDCHPQLSQFCKLLTGIQQAEVDHGVSLKKALEMHDLWLEESGVKNTRFVIVTWSDWDCKVMLEMECKWKSLQKPPYFNRWINLKVPFRKFSGHMQTNLRGAVERLGLVWEGREHCGLDDARNTAYLALELVKKGIILKVTNSFKTYADDGSKLYIPKLRKPKAMPRCFKNAETNVEEVETTIDHNSANIMCFCGVKSRKRVVKKPGPTQGQSFFSCGKWTMTTDGKCLFFLWAPS